jgi:hypothetical protein
MPVRKAAPSILDLTACLTMPVAQLVEEQLGRAVYGQLADQDTIPSIRPPGLVKLQTMGPVTHRHVVLRDVQAPNLVVAVAWAMFVVDRVPPKVRRDLDAGGEPLDRLLTRHGVAWQAELLPDENRKTVVREASANFRWATPDTPLLELTRFVTLGQEPLAALIDEVPELPRLGPGETLVPCRVDERRGRAALSRAAP